MFDNQVNDRAVVHDTVVVIGIAGTKHRHDRAGFFRFVFGFHSTINDFIVAAITTDRYDEWSLMGKTDAASYLRRMAGMVRRLELRCKTTFLQVVGEFFGKSRGVTGTLGIENDSDIAEGLHDKISMTGDRSPRQ